MNKKTWTYVLGALLIAFGVMFILSPAETFENIVLIAGIILIILSSVRIITSVKNNSSYTSSIIGLVFGLILIVNREAAVKVIPVLLGIWLFVSGLSSWLYLMKINYDKKQITKAILKTILGAITLILPIVPVVATGIVLGIILILSGVSTITNAKDDEVIYKVKVKK